MLYEITTDDGHGYATYIARKRWDAASYQIQKAVYDVAGEYGLRDREIAWIALRKLSEAITFRHLGPPCEFTIRGTTITVSVTKLP